MDVSDLGSGLPQRISTRGNEVRQAQMQFTKNPQGGELNPEDQPTVEHLRDPEVVRLVHKLNASPEIREDKVAEVRIRVDSGEYLTRRAAEMTAHSILE